MELRFLHHPSAAELELKCVRSSSLRAASLRFRPSTVSHANPEPRFGREDESEGSCSHCLLCGRRRILHAIAAAASLSSTGCSLASSSSAPKNVLDEVHPRRQWWYEEFYAFQMDLGMKTYESQMAGYKTELFKTVGEKAWNVLEIGIGAGPNIRYYANRPGINITGIDPNPSMEKYARSAAFAAGLQDSQFKFFRGVAESLPVETSSFDAVVCTLVLCSVNDVSATLNVMSHFPFQVSASCIILMQKVVASGFGKMFSIQFSN